MIKGSTHSEEAKARMSKAHKGRKLSEDTRRKMSEARRGKKMPPMSEETKQKLREVHLGKSRGPHSEETKKRISAALRKSKGQSAKGYYITSEGYRKLTAQYEHPLVQKDGCIYEHIKVLYDKIGPGPHLCYWKCGRQLTWGGGSQLGICVDHLDRDRLNNDPQNLVPSCRIENITRGWWCDESVEG